MELTNKTGLINGIKFVIISDIRVKIYKEKDIPFYDFKPRCDYVVKYLIDEGFLKSKQCRVDVVS
jgi:hypothetical protein